MTANRTRGQKAGLTRGAVLDGAVRLVDREGLGKLSMRRLGAEVDVEAMTLYNYFANKDALLDGLVEHLFSRATLALADTGTWRERMRDYAHALRKTLVEHPNLVPLVVSRPAVTPESLRVMEDGLAVLREAGFPARTALDLVYSLNEYVIGHMATAPREGTAPAQEDHFAAIDPDAFPLIAEALGSPRGEGERFDRAVDAMLQGFAEG
ncbi:TetR/AcrR family transcriptional regulator [Glycomyces paridis]|uniref:TetR/AcrR family transcriptional regulator n=1 Tax=Glycomyces paridis TaxID=2126555 RepID=A0A4S8PJ34_9ACTN|nr:TetR/AcrR family transcriptional regulator [Glycomyces paridis]THV30011.1 TetR/AcrR family transcriptional regulator [Glycomyces paridis]